MAEQQTPQNPYEAVLTDLKAKRADLDAAIAAIERIMSGTVASGAFTAAGAATVTVQAAAIRDGMFFGMSLTEAAKAYLQAVRKKQSVREIAAALEQGGFHHTSKDFPNTVRAILARNAANEGDFIKLQTDWGLSAWFPGRRVNKPKKEDSNGLGAGHTSTEEDQHEPEQELELDPGETEK